MAKCEETVWIRTGGVGPMGSMPYHCENPGTVRDDPLNNLPRRVWCDMHFEERQRIADKRANQITSDETENWS